MEILILTFISYSIVAYITWCYYWLLSPSKNSYVVETRESILNRNNINISLPFFLLISLFLSFFFTPLIFVKE